MFAVVENVADDEEKSSNIGNTPFSSTGDIFATEGTINTCEVYIKQA